MALPHLPGLLLGNDFLQQFRKMTIDYTEEGPVLTLGALLEVTEDEQYSVTLVKDQAIPARSWISVDVNLNLRRGRGEEWKTWVIIPSARLMEKKGLSTGYAVVGGRSERVMLVNLSNRPERVQKGATVGFLEEINAVVPADGEEISVVGSLAPGVGRNLSWPPPSPGGVSPAVTEEKPLDFDALYTDHHAFIRRKTKKDMLSFYVSEDQKDLDEKLDLVAFAFNTSVQETMG